MTDVHTRPEQSFSGPYNAVFAAIYEPILWWGERSGMADNRRELLASARGAVLELGAGTGLNLPHYPDTIDRLVLTEPDEHMARRLEQRLERLGKPGKVVLTPAETLPFDDGAFDTVVSTLVLCNVQDPERSLQEIRRVLRPGGSLLFLEHVRSDDVRLARWQDRLHKPWRGFACGCNCNRETLDLLNAEGFTLSGVGRGEWRKVPPIVRPLVSGSASPPETEQR
ncbi:MAG: class I SAM-dependent methyltransferase [Rubrobacteraceae bacterium]